MMYDNEIWKDVVGYEGIYMVSDFGRMKSVERKIPYNRFGGKFRTIPEKILKQVYNKRNNTYHIGLHKGNNFEFKLVHRLEGEAFLSNPENKRTINHKDGNRANNHLSNLEWNTHAENVQHAFDVLKRKPSGAAVNKGKDAYWFGKNGAQHPCYGNESRKGKTGFLSNRGKKVKCDTLDIEFGSGADAARQLGVNISDISDICLNKQLHVKGLTFRYI